MRIFLSYSGHDAAIVTEVWERLGPQVTWLDKADIDLGDIILEKIAAGIEEATDLLLFWSKRAQANLHGSKSSCTWGSFGSLNKVGASLE